MMNDTTRGHRQPRQRLRRAGLVAAAASAAVFTAACGGPSSPAGPSHPPGYEQLIPAEPFALGRMAVGDQQP